MVWQEKGCVTYEIFLVNSSVIILCLVFYTLAMVNKKGQSVFDCHSIKP